MRRFGAIALYLYPLLWSAGQSVAKPQTARKQANPVPVSAEAGKTAYKAERAREQLRPCDSVPDNAKVRLCYERQLAITSGHYKKLKANIRNGLAPSSRDDEMTTHTENRTVAEFDKAERSWGAYESDQCGAVYNSYVVGSETCLFIGADGNSRQLNSLSAIEGAR